MKMSGKSEFLFSLELASSTIGLHIGKSCFGVFSKILNSKIQTSRLHTRGVGNVAGYGWLPWQRKLFFFIFFSSVALCTP